jgi:hypothetical protein
MLFSYLTRLNKRFLNNILEFNFNILSNYSFIDKISTIITLIIILYYYINK